MGIKILYVIDAYEVGGGERFLTNLLRHGLMKEDFEEWVCTLREAGYFKKIKSEGIPVINLLRGSGPRLGFNIPKWRKVLTGLTTMVALPRLVRLIRQERFCVVVSIGYPASLVVAAASWFVRRPAYVYRCAYPRSILLPFEKLLMGAVLKRYQSIVCVSGAVRESLLTQFSWLAPRTTIIHNGVSLKNIQKDSLAKAEHCSDVRKRMQIGTKEIVFISMGRFVPEKGYDVLIKAFQSVLARNSSAVLIFIGDGPLRHSIEAEVAQSGIRERVRFLGIVKNPFDVLAIGDVFILPSRSEGFSNALLEAMSVGLPVIASDIDSVCEVIDHEVTGLLVPKMDVAALAGAMDTLARNALLREQLGRKAKELMLEKFSINAVRERYNALYRTCITGLSQGKLERRQ